MTLWRTKMSLVFLLFLRISGYGMTEDRLRYRFQEGSIYSYLLTANNSRGGSTEEHLDLRVLESQVSDFSLVLMPGRYRAQQAHFTGRSTAHSFPKSVNWSGQQVTTQGRGTQFFQPTIFEPRLFLLFDLSGSQQREWTTEKAVIKYIYDEAPSRPGFPFDPFGGRGFRPQQFSMPKGPTARNGKETITHRVVSRSATTAVVAFEYKTASEEGGFYSGEGKGRFVLDMLAGVILSVEFEGKYALRDQGQHQDSTISLNLELQEQRLDSSRLQRTHRKENYSPMSEDLANLALTKLDSNESEDRKDGLLAIYRYGPGREATREKIVKALEQQIGRLTGPEAFWCTSSLGHWGKEGSANKLLELLTHKDRYVRLGAVEGLGKISESKHAAEMLRVLGDEGAVRPIIAAMKRLGTTGEALIRDRLTVSDSNVRRDACRVLGSIGTKESLPNLELLTNDADEEVSQAAKAAIARIEHRTGKRAEE